MKSFKGFNKDMTCRGFQYEEGKSYETKKADVCKEGFHACEYPLDCFSYYNPAESVFHEVEQDGELSKNEDKTASTKIKIGVRLSIADLVKAAIDFTMSKVKPEASADEEHGASSATGNCGASSATGNYGASSATGNCGASSATGYKGASSATGNCGVASVTGYNSSAEVKNPTALAVAWGYKSHAKGVKGSYLVLADWEGDEDYPNNPEKWTLKGVNLVHIDGKKYKENTWYEYSDGVVKEWIEE